MPGTTKENNKTKNTYVLYTIDLYQPMCQPKLWSIGTIHRPITIEKAAHSPRLKSHNTLQHMNPAHHQHTKPWPAPQKPCRFIPRSR